MAALHVTMNDAVLMQMSQALRYLSTHCCNLAFGHQICRNNIRERATFHILHHNPELVLVKERVNIIDDIRMTQSPQYEDFVYKKIPFRRLVQVHPFDRNRKISPNLASSKHTTISATRAPRKRCRGE
jgi:hypothetical protein